MFKRIRKINRQFWHLISSKIDPNGYAKSLGVKLGNNVVFYGMKPEMFTARAMVDNNWQQCIYYSWVPVFHS